jgi:hypothetical protein
MFNVKRIFMGVSTAVLVAASVMAAAAATMPAAAAREASLPTASLSSLATDLRVGDVVFIRIASKPFREVAAATDSWTNHVGVVVDTSGSDVLIGESKFPLSRTTPLAKFVGRSEGGRVAVLRLKNKLTPEQQERVVAAAERRSGIFYDTDFNVHSRRQFCARYVREVLLEATGTGVGEVETFSHVLARKRDANLGFWKLWYLGRIPWQRETVTPASVLRSPELQLVFDVKAVVARDNQGPTRHLAPAS